MTTDEIRKGLNEVKKTRGRLAKLATEINVKQNTLLKIANGKIKEPGNSIAQKIIAALKDVEVSNA